MSLDLYAIGNALVDSEFLVSDAFLAQQSIDKGCMTLVDEHRRTSLLDALSTAHPCTKRASGGSAANSVIAFSAFGGQAFYACKVANDSNGNFYLSDLSASGVRAPAHAKVAHGVTGTCIVMVTPDSERTMNTHLGITAEMSAAELDLDELAKARFLYIEGYLATSPTARTAVHLARQIARQRGIITAITLSDPAMVQYARDGLAEMIAEGVDILFCNEIEACQWTGADGIASAIAALHAISPLVIVTRGSQGAIASERGEQTVIPSFPVKAVDSNGAGDAFAGAFLYGLSQGWSLERAGTLASRTAAEVVSRFGPRLTTGDYQSLAQELAQQ